MDHVMKYRTADKKRQRRLRFCTNVDDPEDLKSELGAMRFLACEAVERSNIALADRLLTGIGKLAKTQVDVQRLRGEYFTRETVARVLDQCVGVLCDAVQDKFPGWEEAIDRAADEIMQTVAATKNEDDQ